MTLEDESLKQRGIDPRSLRRPLGLDGIVRGIAFLILLAGLTAMFWIPFQFLGPIGAAFILSALTLLVANLASRLHKLRQRVDELEAMAVPVPPEFARQEAKGPDQK